VQRVSGIIAAIANSAGEQNNGIQQVSGAIGRLDQITQQNAALVEQSAAAAESVRDQATRLQGRVAMFKVA
jgi:methyl-accepting chemotaxis protein